MTTYTIINPSDPYTLQGDDLAVLAVATILLGNGQYALVPDGTPHLTEETPAEVVQAVVDGLTVPMFLFGTADPWFQAQFGKPAADVIDDVLASKTEALVACLQSVLIGDRAEFAAMADGLTHDSPEWRQAWVAWHDTHRSSMNDIGRNAMKLATKVRAGAIEVRR